MLEVVYKMLKIYSHDETILTHAQKQELDKTLADHKAGRLKYYTLKQAQETVYGKAKKR